MSTKIDAFMPATVRPAGGEARIARLGTSAKGGDVAATAEADSLSLTSTAGDLRSLEKELAQVPVADHARVDAIRLSISQGTFKIDPQKIADNLLAMEGALRR